MPKKKPSAKRKANHFIGEASDEYSQMFREEMLEKFGDDSPEMRDDGTIVDGTGTPLIRPY